MNKHCTSCGLEKPLERFYSNRNKCKDCHNKEANDRYHANKDLRRDQNLRNLYGITLEEYNQMYADQEGCCACCGRHATEFTRNLAVDHDHDTGEVRALLCTHCNTAYGSLQENEERIHQLLRYHTSFKGRLQDLSPSSVEPA